MGLFNTLHGQPDGRLRGCVLEETDVIGIVSDDDDSDSGTLTIDGKKALGEEHMSWYHRLLRKNCTTIIHLYHH